MPPVDAELVRRIAQRVIEQMTATGRPRADVKPPIGVCTGDYSQFVDRPDLTKSPDSAPPPEPVNNALTPAGLSGIVTARQVDAVAGDTLYLQYDAKLTALAADRVRERKMAIERVYGSSSGPAAGSWLWWIDGRCSAVPGVVGQHPNQLVASRARDLVSAIREIAVGVKAGRLAGGVLFVPSAARPACYANRCGVLRAAVGTCVQAVEQAVAELAANVLIVEYPYHDAQRMVEMVAAFLAAAGKPSAAVQRELKELSSCA